MPIADPGAGAATPAPPLSVDDQIGRLTDADDVINPLTFPEPSVSVGYVEAMASGLRELGTSIADTGNDITSSWAGLSAHYSAPEAETLFSVLDPVATDGDTVGEELDRVAGALEDFAQDVADIKTRWSNLRVEAYDLRSRIAAEGDDWDKADGVWDRIAGNESPLVEENKALIDQGRTIITDYTEVENTCANAINAGIVGRTQFEKQPEGDAELDPNVFYHGFEQDISELAQAWGHEGARTDHGWWVDVGHSVWDFGVDAVQGVGAMVGAHSSQGWFEASWGDALKEYHWDNLTSAASLVGMYDAESDSLSWAGWGSMGEAWKDLAHSVVPWEEWGDRPGYVIGTAALNVIGLVGGAALTATGVGAVVGVPLMAWRGMSIMDGMGGSGRGGGSGGVDIDVPQIPDIPRFGGSGSPLIDLTGRALEATGFGPSQWADIKAVINRLMPPGQNGVESAGATSTHTGGEAEGGRPGGARPTQTSGEADHRPVRRPAQDPTVGDALAFDDIVNHPDNQAFGEQARSTRQGQIDEVDQAAKTGSNGTPASEEGRWTGGAGDGRGPDEDSGKVPEMAGGGRPSDTMEASAAKNTPAATERVRLTDIDGPGGDRPFGNEIASDQGDRGANMSDRAPTARNQDGVDSGADRDSPGDNNSINYSPDNSTSSYSNDSSDSHYPTSAPDPQTSRPEMVQDKWGDMVEYGSTDHTGRWFDQDGIPHVEAPDLIEQAKVYSRARESLVDVDRISDATGVQKDVIERIKNHIFHKTHEVAIGPNEIVTARFTPMPHIAQWWEQAQNNRVPDGEEEYFRRWLAHESVESKLMEWGMPYLSSSPEAFEWDDIYEKYTPTPKKDYYGAHNISPSEGRARPFDHYLEEWIKPEQDLNDDLSNSEEIARDIFERFNK